MVLFDVFLGIQKAYDALDWEMALGLLAKYRVGPKTFQILRTYWAYLTMVAKAGR